jgi:hypothetical protein
MAAKCFNKYISPDAYLTLYSADCTLGFNVIWFIITYSAVMHISCPYTQFRGADVYFFL